VTEWVRSVWTDTEPYASAGTYVNALDAGRPVREAYAGDVYDRLVAVKRRYDPEGVFAGNGIAAG
jgi:FAD/FMN-containing dehydrogenase